MSTKCEKCGQVTEYNGWSSYETWAVNLWLDSEEGSQREMVRICTRGTVYEAEKDLKAWVDDMNPLTDGPASMFQDLLGAALDMVRWREIVEAHRGDE